MAHSLLRNHLLWEGRPLEIMHSLGQISISPDWGLLFLHCQRDGILFVSHAPLLPRQHAWYLGAKTLQLQPQIYTKSG